MFQCSSCQSVLKGHETLPHVNGSDTVQCVPCHDSWVRAAGRAEAYEQAVERVERSIGMSSTPPERRRRAGNMASTLAVAFDRTLAQVHIDLGAAPARRKPKTEERTNGDVDPICGAAHARGPRVDAYRLAIGKITQALEPFGPAGNRRLFLKGSSSIDWHDAARVLAVAFGLPFEQVSKDVEAAFDPTAGAAP